MSGRGAVLFHAAADPRMGVGHLSRCVGLAAEAHAEGRTVLLVAEGPRSATAALCRGDFLFECAETREEALAARTRFLRARPTATLVTDWLGATRADSEQARAQGFRSLVHLSDTGGYAYEADLFVDMDGSMSHRKNELGERLCSGYEFTLVRPSVRAVRPTRAWERGRVDTIVFAFGGSDPGRLSERVVDGRADLPRGVRATLILGPAVEASRVAALRRGNPEGIDAGEGSARGPVLEIAHAPDDFVSRMASADLVVSVGGQIAYEANCLGVPVVAVRWGHLAPYVARGIARGMFLEGGPEDGFVARTSSVASDPESMARTASRAFAVIDGGGAARVLAAIDRLEARDVR